MRALVLLLLCVVLLAALQASYIVTEAKKHNEMRAVDDGDHPMDGADRKSKHEKKMRRNRKKGIDTTDVDIADETGYPVNDLAKADPDMPSDQPAGRRQERVSKEERRARKAERRERKDQRQAAKATRAEKKANKQERGDRRQGNAEKKAERQEKKKNKKARKEERQQQEQVACTSDAGCVEGECCIPKRGGEMFCKANRKPRKAGKKCITSCTCEGDLACYLENPAADAPQRPRNRQLGKCVAASAADLTMGMILAAGPQETAPGA